MDIDDATTHPACLTMDAPALPLSNVATRENGRANGALTNPCDGGQPSRWQRGCSDSVVAGDREGGGGGNQVHGVSVATDEAGGQF